MAIVFAGGVVRNPRNPNHPPLVIANDDARFAAWNDFLDGLRRLEEQRLFGCIELPDGRGQLTLMDPGMNPNAPDIHDHVRELIGEAANNDRTIHVMPVPMVNIMAPGLEWVSELNQGNTTNRMRFQINGYGAAFEESLGLGAAALGRTHVLRPRGDTRDNGIVYATSFAGRGIDPVVLTSWNIPFYRVLTGRMVGDTPGVWIDRESTVNLFHELIHHAIRGLWDEIDRGGVPVPDPRIFPLENRARRNWVRNRGE